MVIATKLSCNGKDKYVTVLNLDKGMPTLPWMFYYEG